MLLLAATGCSQANSTRLPELSSIPRKLLSAEEQKKAVDDLKAHKETAQAEAIKEIEAEKPRQR